MSRGKNCLPTVSRQFLTRNYPRPNCLLKCLPNCLSPTREGFLSSFKINPAVRVIARQVRDKNCLAAIFAPRHQSVSSGRFLTNGSGGSASAFGSWGKRFQRLKRAESRTKKQGKSEKGGEKKQGLEGQGLLHCSDLYRPFQDLSFLAEKDFSRVQRWSVETPQELSFSDEMQHFH